MDSSKVVLALVFAAILLAAFAQLNFLFGPSLHEGTFICNSFDTQAPCTFGEFLQNLLFVIPLSLFLAPWSFAGLFGDNPILTFGIFFGMASIIFGVLSRRRT